MLCRGEQSRGRGLGGGKVQLKECGRVGLPEKVRSDRGLKELSQAEVCRKGILGRGKSQGQAPRPEQV